MAQENAPYKVSEPVVAVMDGLTRFTTRVLTNIRDGNTTIEQLESFLDWFFDISVEDREDMFTPLDETPPFLKLLTQRKPLKISALPGYKLITQHWFHYTDSAFELYNDRGNPTPITPVLVYEIIKEGVNFGQLFGSLSGRYDGTCLTQHQIIYFFSQFRGWLQSGGGLTCFLFKNKDTLHVACIEKQDNGYTKIFRDSLINCPLWNPEKPPRIVVPKWVP